MCRTRNVQTLAGDEGFPDDDRIQLPLSLQLLESPEQVLRTHR